MLHSRSPNRDLSVQTVSESYIKLSPQFDYFLFEKLIKSRCCPRPDCMRRSFAGISSKESNEIAFPCDKTLSMQSMELLSIYFHSASFLSGNVNNGRTKENPDIIL